MDCVGPLGRSVADVAAGLAAVAGYDPTDPYCGPTPRVTTAPRWAATFAALRLGLPTNTIYRFGQPEVLSILEQGRQALVDLGLTPFPLELPRAEETNAVCDLILEVDLWLYHERLQDNAAQYGRDFTLRAQRGRQTTAIQYARAKVAQAEIRRLWLDVFERIDVLALPANAAAAPRHGVNTIEIDGASYPFAWSRRASIVLRTSSVCRDGGAIGATADGLRRYPARGPPFAEARLFAVGHALEQALGNLPPSGASILSQWRSLNI